MLISSTSCHVPLTDSHSCNGPKYHWRYRPKKGDSTHRPHLTQLPSSSPAAPLIIYSSPPQPSLVRCYNPPEGTHLFLAVAVRVRGGKVLLNVRENFMRTLLLLLLYPSALPTLSFFLFPVCLLCVLFCQHNDCGEHGECCIV